MTVEKDKEEVWRKISTVPEPKDPYAYDPLVNYDSISKRFSLMKYLELTKEEVDELMDGYSSERKRHRR